MTTANDNRSSCKSCSSMQNETGYGAVMVGHGTIRPALHC